MDKFADIPFADDIEEHPGPSSPNTEENGEEIERLSSRIATDTSKWPAQQLPGDDKPDDHAENCNVGVGFRTLLIHLIKYLPYGYRVMLVALLGQLLHIVDLVLDICVTVNFFIKGKYILTILSTVFIVIPYLCNIFLSLLGYRILSKNQRLSCAIKALHIFPVVPAVWSIPQAVMHVKEDKRYKKVRYRRTPFTLRVFPCLLSFTECFLESIPQFLIQSFDLFTSKVDEIEIVTVLSFASSLLTMTWAVSNLWFTVREIMYYPSSCGLKQLSTLIHYLSNLCMLTGRLMTVGLFVASVGPRSLVYFLPIQACLSALTDAAVNWNHASRCERSIDNIVSRLLETFCLLVDVPFTITFMLGPARIFCYVIWALENFLVVFFVWWLSRSQAFDAANMASTVLETSKVLQFPLFVVIIVSTTLGISLRYLHYHQELNNLHALVKRVSEDCVCQNGKDRGINQLAKTLQEKNVVVHIEDALDKIRKTDSAVKKLGNLSKVIDSALGVAVSKISQSSTGLHRMKFAKDQFKKLRQNLNELRGLTKQFKNIVLNEHFYEKWLEQVDSALTDTVNKASNNSLEQCNFMSEKNQVEKIRQILNELRDLKRQLCTTGFTAEWLANLLSVIRQAFNISTELPTLKFSKDLFALMYLIPAELNLPNILVRKIVSADRNFQFFSERIARHLSLAINQVPESSTDLPRMQFATDQFEKLLQIMNEQRYFIEQYHPTGFDEDCLKGFLAVRMKFKNVVLNEHFYEKWLEKVHSTLTDAVNKASNFSMEDYDIESADYEVKVYRHILNELRDLNEEFRTTGFTEKWLGNLLAVIRKAFNISTELPTLKFSKDLFALMYLIPAELNLPNILFKNIVTEVNNFGNYCGDLYWTMCSAISEVSNIFTELPWITYANDAFDDLQRILNELRDFLEQYHATGFDEDCLKDMLAVRMKFNHILSDQKYFECCLHELDNDFSALVGEAHSVYEELPKVIFAKDLFEFLKKVLKALRKLEKPIDNTWDLTRERLYGLTSFADAVHGNVCGLKYFLRYFREYGQLHNTLNLDTYRKTLDVFSANIIVGVKCKMGPHTALSEMQSIHPPVFPVQYTPAASDTSYIWPTKLDEYAHFDADIKAMRTTGFLGLLEDEDISEMPSVSESEDDSLEMEERSWNDINELMNMYFKKSSKLSYK